MQGCPNLLGTAKYSSFCCMQGKFTTPQVQARHIADALSKAHPSVPPSEQRRLQALYDKFKNNRAPNIGSVDNKGKGKQLATLA